VLALRGKIAEEVNQDLKNLLLSIPGVGLSIAAAAITEIGDIQRFPSGKSLVAYAGLLTPKSGRAASALKETPN